MNIEPARGWDFKPAMPTSNIRSVVAMSIKWAPPQVMPAMPTMREIVADVARRHGVTPDDIRGPSRRRSFVRPRHEAMWLMRQVRFADGSQRYSLPQIAQFLGGRDHTTVLNGVRRYEDRRKKNPDVGAPGIIAR